MHLVKPSILAQALNTTTAALKMRRRRVTKSSKSNHLVGASEYIVTDSGRVKYLFNELPPSVRADVEKITTKVTKQKHEDLMQRNFRYANSIGKVNERKKRLHQAEVDKRAKELLEKEQMAAARARGREPLRKENNYIRWIHQHEMTPNWKPIHETRTNKKKYSYYS